CARPLNPLAYTFAVIKKKFKDIAKRNEPNITIAIRLASIKNIQPSFLIRIITFYDNTDKQKLQFFTAIFNIFLCHPIYVLCYFFTDGEPNLSQNIILSRIKAIIRSNDKPLHING